MFGRTSTPQTEYVQGFQIDLIDGGKAARRNELPEQFQGTPAMPLGRISRILVGIMIRDDGVRDFAGMARTGALFN